MTPGTWIVAGHRGMTLLHLAAALGYVKLVGSLLTWRSENPNAILETEVDALSQDQQGYTPLVRIIMFIRVSSILNNILHPMLLSVTII